MLTGEHVRHKMVPGGSAVMEFPGRIKRRADPPGEAGLHRHHAVCDDEQVDVAVRRIGSRHDRPVHQGELDASGERLQRPPDWLGNVSACQQG